ncbi:MAG: acylneuraminate cytidylyltransferase family protein [Prevotella sp.]|jgi:N-acylneuraminate cytidylyltransferase|nr:acylneuraminate cytidylyltransferase family protein [Prevotella sp.]
MHTIAIIPARGGSKGIPRKNIKEFCGKPLIAWSIETALGAKHIDEVYLSTEDEEIAETGKKYGAKISMRSKYLSTDSVTTKEVLIDFVNRYECDTLVVLQPTSPIRIGGLIDRTFERFIKTGADTLATGFISLQYEWTSVDNTPRQQLRGWFYDDGNIYIHKPYYLKDGKYWGEKRECMLIDEYYNYEIDTEYDWIILESLMKYVNSTEVY